MKKDLKNIVSLIVDEWESSHSLEQCESLLRNHYAKRLMPPKDERKCLICDTTFVAKVYTQKYCSDRCCVKADIQKRTNKPKEKDCAVCGSPFKPYTTLDKYCSIKCRVANQKNKRKSNYTNDRVQKIIGENNPAYRNGMYMRASKRINKGQLLFAKNSKTLRESIVAEYGHIQCECCTTNNSLRWEVHHIIYRSEKPNHPHLHDIENLLHLCIQCHNKFHKTKGMRDYLVAHRGLDKLFGQDVLNKTQFAKDNGFSESRII
jgi:hypothetical protein